MTSKENEQIKDAEGFYLDRDFMLKTVAMKASKSSSEMQDTLCPRPQWS